tara:strand:- start:351 stop:1499 length:1149 start_codon:yes stop_codon:yes gene_type:complete
MNSSINLSEPNVFNREIRLVNNALKKNQLAIGDNLKKFEESLKKYLKIKHVTLCSSGSNALITIMKILNLNHNDEVIVPTLTFVAPINACTLFKANPIFFDCDKFHNIDLKKVIDFIESKTVFIKKKTINKKTKRWIKAIMLVHVWGNACDIEKIYKLCKRRNIKIIEDASESLGTKYKIGKFKNKFTGTVGDIGCLSFNGNKIITTGSGGAIVTNNKDYAKKARLYINHYKTDTVKFIHKDEGFNFRMNNIQASIGIGQLKKINYFIKEKKIINKNYRKIFSGSKKYFVNPSPLYSDNNLWLNVISTKKSIDTIKIIKKLIKKKINVRKPWFPNHLQKPFKKYETYKISNAIKVFKNSICVPSSVGLSLKQIHQITKCLHD